MSCPDDLRDLPPPGALPRRVAEVTVALIEAWACSAPGHVPDLAEIHLYDSAQVSLADTELALADACDRGLADGDWDGWQPTAEAWQLRVYLEDWFYAT